MFSAAWTRPTERLRPGITAARTAPTARTPIGISENVAEQTIAKGWTRVGSGPWRPTGHWNSDEAAKEIVDGWIGSTGHRENILDADVKRIGVGIQLGRKLKEGILTDVLFATQNFSKCS